MTELQAAVALAQLTRLEEQMRRREANAALLDELLGEIEGVRLLRRDPRMTRHAYHLYIFKLAPELAERVDKDDFCKKVMAEGVPLYGGYVPLNRNEAVIRATKEWTGEERIYDCPICERLCANESVWLTQNLLLSDERAMHDIAMAVRKVIRSY
jgi:dTDP-4-amino-4,6-dideoxygalactose transaminase